MKTFTSNFLLLSLTIFATSYCEELVYDDQNVPADYTYIECTLKPRVRRPEDSSHTNLPLNVRGCASKPTSSDNWGGYVALTSLTNPKKDSVNYITGTWKVPTVTKTPIDAYTAVWVGIDGWTSPTVEQIGTEHDWINGKQSNYAWFEIYPRYAHEIVGFPVEIGDSISTYVRYLGNKVFALTIMNNTKKVVYKVPQSMTTVATAQRSSAEWIVEPPSTNVILPLSHFSPITWTQCSCTINGVLGAINNCGWINGAITLEESVPKAVTSPLTASGKGFTVKWLHI